MGHVGTKEMVVKEHVEEKENNLAVSVLRRRLADAAVRLQHAVVAHSTVGALIAEDYPTESVADYARAMRGSRWGGYIEMLLFNRVYGVGVELYEEQQGSLFYLGGDLPPREGAGTVHIASTSRALCDASASPRGVAAAPSLTAAPPPAPASSSLSAEALCTHILRSATASANSDAASNAP